MANAQYDSSLEIFRAGDSSLKLSYVTYGIWEQHQTQGDPKLENRYWFFIGQNTTANGKPTSGSATYNGIIDGEFIGATSRVRLGGSGTLQYDFATDLDTGQFAIDQPDGTSDRKAFDTITFVNKPATSANISSSNGSNGIFATLLMGPHAEEAAAYFTLNNNAGGLVTGVFVGKR